jgi:lactate racemase
MKFMHSFSMVDHPRVANANLRGNPFKEYIDQAGQAAGMDFLVNVIIDRNKEITAVYSGDPVTAHQAGCGEAGNNAVVRVDRPGDLAVTTGGGYPIDQTLYQSSKGLAAVKDLIRPGGTIIWVTGCGEGLGGQEFQDLVGSVGGPGDFREKYSRKENFVIDQWGAQVYFQVLETAGEILLFCPNLSQDQVAPFGLTKIDDLQTVVDGFVAQGGQTYISPEGPYLVGRAGS